jgi:hypothetical protein
MFTVYKVGTMIRAFCDRRYVCTDEWYEAVDFKDGSPMLMLSWSVGNKKGAVKK